MTKKFHELEIISRINADGSGVIPFTQYDTDRWMENPLTRNEEYELHRLSISEGTFIAFNGTVFVVKLKPDPRPKPLKDISADDFMEFTTEVLCREGERMVFEFTKTEWKATSVDQDEEEDFDDDHIISNKEEDNPEEILMLHLGSYQLSNGWLVYQETYNTCDLNLTAKWVKFLEKKGYDIFNTVKP